jgi:multidrug efflux pump subunit AcrA (membrane-fusion protein)
LPHAAARGTPVGTRVEFETEEADGVTRYAGRIVHVASEINPVTRDVQVWAEIENAEGQLQPGLRGRLRILPAGKREP